MSFPAHWDRVALGTAGAAPEPLPPAPPRGQWRLPDAATPTPLPARQAGAAARRPSAAVFRAAEETPPSGPRFTRAELETLAAGAISKIFGPMFAAQDGYRRQVRMPMPPLLLADRVIGLVGTPGSHGTGTIWTETDITPDAWYLHHGRMPAGIAVEAGQADLLLCSWLGADLKNRGERVYRLLGCDLVFHAGLPGVGETLRYEIHITGHAELGGIRLFFFHSDCRSDGRLVLSVRNGQAGFFTDDELAQSRGVLWSPSAADGPAEPGRVDEPQALTRKRVFDDAAVRAFAEGRLLDCFGEGFEPGASHTRSPGIPTGRMRLFDRVTAFDPQGGPWRRGYLRAERSIADDDWFFAGHFKDDPCMPGTLMCEGGMQVMAFYLAALGATLRRDGWRFEPLPGEVFRMRCRGQLTPAARLLVYEIFVQDCEVGPGPVLRADLLCTVDGLQAFHSAGAALRLVPGWPGDLLPAPPLRPDGAVDLFTPESAMAAALGQPSRAFGPRFARFDGEMRGPRLPGPPYHFITRVLEAELGDATPRAGATVTAAYDIPPDAWYFAADGTGAMPFAVLLEAALQPCGWLATAVGCPLLGADEVFFRNLDGTAVQHRALTPRSGRLTTRATLTTVTTLGAMVLVGFEVVCEAAGVAVLTMKTGFGFFPAAALADQTGLPLTPEVRAAIGRPGNLDLDLRARPAALFAGTARLAVPPLLMLDCIIGHWPDGGRAGLGLIRGEKRVEPREWFFKAHFYRDPVQPGSLGIAALLQLLAALMLRDGMAEGIPGARFQPLALGVETTWRFRGQVLPTNRTITSVVEVLERGQDDHGALAIASGMLLVDGRMIYHVPRFGLRLVPGGAAESVPGAPWIEELTLDPARDRWLADHCPTFVIPVLPFMVVADLLAGAAARLAPGRKLAAPRDVKLRGWIAFGDGARRLRVAAEPAGADRVRVQLLVWRDAPRAAMSRFDLLATAEADFSDAWPTPPAPTPPAAWPEVTGGTLLHELGGATERDLYAAGESFHGPMFHRLRALRWDDARGSALIDADPGEIPSRALNPLLLDAAAQGIAGDRIGRLDPLVPPDAVSFPVEISRLSLHGPTPSAGLVRCELRYLGRDPDNPRFLRFALQLIQDGQVWAEMALTEVTYPMGRLGGTLPRDRRDLALRRRAVPGAGLSAHDDGTTRLSDRALAAADWLPGTVARIYASTAAEPAALRRDVAVKDHLADAWAVHPATIAFDPATGLARSAALPYLTRRLAVVEDGDMAAVSDRGGDALERDALSGYWLPRLGGAENAASLVLDELCARFLRHLRLEAPEAIAALRGRPVLLLGNHQVHLESVIFSELLGPLLGEPAVTVSRIEHRTSWIGAAAMLTAGFPGAGPHEPIVFFDRADPADMLRLLADYRARLLPQRRSLMVHVTGEAARSCRELVTRVSAVLLDLAIDCDLPILPVRFIGALPAAPLPRPITFPIGLGRQDIVLGAPIMPAELRALRLIDRVRRVAGAINDIRPRPEEEAPLAPQPAFAAAIGARVAAGGSEVAAVLRASMAAVADRAPGLRGFAEGRVPDGWSGARARWGETFLAWLHRPQPAEGS